MPRFLPCLLGLLCLTACSVSPAADEHAQPAPDMGSAIGSAVRSPAPAVAGATASRPIASVVATPPATPGARIAPLSLSPAYATGAQLPLPMRLRLTPAEGSHD